jgi:signal transduction histidine kinase/DNA-binding response OmpR family regulator
MAQILVVDDDPEVGSILRELLHTQGHSALLAGSGEEALERLEREAVDLVLLDARLPGLSGFETCARIRALRGASLPVLMVSGYGDREAVLQAGEVGADDLIHKPVQASALLLKVRSFLRMKSLHDEALRHREEAQARVRDLALLHEIGRDWSLIAEPEEFHRVVASRLAALIGAPICFLALYDHRTRVLAAALPVHGLPDEVARRIRYTVKPEYRSLWNFRSGRPYVSNRARSDPRLVPEFVIAAGAESVVLVPMISEGRVLGLLCAANKPAGFSEDDVQLLSIFAGPAATFLRSRQIFERQRRHAVRLERLSELMGALAGSLARAELLELTVSRLHEELGYDRVVFWVPDADGEELRVELAHGAERPGAFPVDPARLKWALRGGTPLESNLLGVACELTVPVRAGSEPLGVLDVLRLREGGFEEEEISLLAALSGQLALALKRAGGVAETERLARQMATLYDVGLETAALRDLRQLFERAAEEAGRLIGADHTSVLRAEEGDERLALYAAWARDPLTEPFAAPVFRIGEGIAGRVARDRVPALVNDAERHEGFVPMGNPVARLLCVPLTYYDREREAPALFGVLNATRRPGAAPFGHGDLEYLTRFASQLSIAVANSMAFAAERQRSEQLALVNSLLREIAGILSRDRIFETVVRRIHEAFRYPAVMVGVPDEAAGVNRLVAAVGREPGPQGWGNHPLDAGIAGRAIREKRSVLVPDVSLAPDYLPLIPWTRSELVVPILSGGEVVAVLNVESDRLAAFGPSELMTLETLADGIGITLRNAELVQALEGTNTRLVELDRARSELIDIVAHDFRSPLAGVLGYAELLEWRPDAPREERAQSARAIVNAATHMSSLVEKTLKTSRLESGQFPFDFGSTDAVAVARGAAGRFAPSGLHPLSLDLPDQPVPCWGDAERLGEVLDNLLSNAVKYSPEGGPVRLGVAREGEGVGIRVADRGMGISAEERQRLFRPFSRLRSAKVAGIEGSGLGLYICDRIVRAHGGRLSVESGVGEGSTFVVWLPQPVSEAEQRPPLVLVAAGDAATRRAVRRVAEELGFAAEEVADGVEAVEAAVRLLPTALVMDRVLPRLPAVAVAQRLRADPATRQVALLVLAAEADLDDQVSLFRACVPKPLDRRVLASALESLALQAFQEPRGQR